MAQVAPEKLDDQTAGGDCKTADESHNRVESIHHARNVVGALVLCLIFQLIGGAVFEALEKDKEKQVAESYTTTMAYATGDTTDPENGTCEDHINNVLSIVSSLGRCSLPDLSMPNWTYAGGCFFAMTLFTTIGYGTFTPETSEGRAFTVFYGILGITIFGLFLSSFSLLLHDFEHMLENKYNQGVKFQRRARLLVMGALVTVWVVIAPLLGSGEGWNTEEGMYWAVITLTTIGLGDYAHQASTLSVIAVVGLTVWTCLGLGVLGNFLAIVAEEADTTADHVLVMMGDEATIERKLAEDREANLVETNRRFGCWVMNRIRKEWKKSQLVSVVGQLRANYYYSRGLAASGAPPALFSVV